VVLENHGEIGASYSLTPNDTPLGSCFDFSPDNGTLGPREQVTVEVGFLSGVLGEVSETFLWMLQVCEPTWGRIPVAHPQEYESHIPPSLPCI